MCSRTNCFEALSHHPSPVRVLQAAALLEPSNHTIFTTHNKLMPRTAIYISYIRDLPAPYCPGRPIPRRRRGGPVLGPVAFVAAPAAAGLTSGKPSDLRDASELENELCRVFKPGVASPFGFGGVLLAAPIGGGRPIFFNNASFTLADCAVWNDAFEFGTAFVIDMSAGVPNEKGCGAASFHALWLPAKMGCEYCTCRIRSLALGT